MKKECLIRKVGKRQEEKENEDRKTETKIPFSKTRSCFMPLLVTTQTGVKTINQKC